MFSDWIDFFWKQIESINLIQPGIFNIPWLFVSFQPLRLIGKYPALVLLQIVSFYFIYKVSRQQNLSKGRTVMVFLSAPVLWNFFMGQVDGLIIGAYLLPPTLAVLFTLFKPQTCLWAGWDGIKKNHWLILMALILILLAFLIWQWPFSTSDPNQVAETKFAWLPPIVSGGWNWSFWPWGILLLPLILRKNKTTGMFLSPFIFPYTGLQSLIGPVISLAAVAPFWLFLLFWLSLWLRWAWMLKYF